MGASASPVTVGSASSASLARRRTASGSAFARRSTGTTMPPSCSSSASEQVVGRHLRVAARAGQALGGGEGLLGLDCEAICLHRKSKSWFSIRVLQASSRFGKAIYGVCRAVAQVVLAGVGRRLVRAVVVRVGRLLLGRLALALGALLGLELGSRRVALQAGFLPAAAGRAGTVALALARSPEPGSVTTAV